MPLAVAPQGMSRQPHLCALVIRGAQLSTELHLRLSCVLLGGGWWCLCIPLLQNVMVAFFFFFFLSTIYNVGLTRSPRAAHTNTEYSTTTLRSACYVLPKPQSLLLAGDHKHKAHGLFQDNVALLSGECGREPAGRGNRHVYPRIALGKVP
jgi:hypothetical protein